MLSSSNAPRKPISHLNQLLTEQHILMMLLKEFRDGILICNRQGQILQLNHSLKHFLQFSDAVIGQQATNVIHNERFQELLTSVLETGGSCVEEITLENGVSHEMFFEVHLVPVYLPVSQLAELSGGEQPESGQASAQEVDGCVIIFHDITDIRQTEKMRRDFVANVSHELRTPLSAIEGYSETLLEGALDDKAVCRDFINVIHRHSLRLTQLVEDLLDLSKLESPGYKPEFSPTSLKTLIQQAFLLVEDKAAEKQIHILIDIQESLPLIMADSSSMQQVLTNLLDNAIKYTPNQGRVSIRVFATEQGKVRIDVQDNGMGIDPKYHHRIFERFYRVDKARSREMGGTGLGLSIVKHIVQLHGGEIWVDSAVNQGSTFSLALDPAPI
jgi:two-component system phosphate regulon sensor histidine kinase PhoR